MMNADTPVQKVLVWIHCDASDNDDGGGGGLLMHCDVHNDWTCVIVSYVVDFSRSSLWLQ